MITFKSIIIALIGCWLLVLGLQLADASTKSWDINQDALRPKYEYHMNIDNDGYDLYSGDKYIARIPFGSVPMLDSIFIADNL